MNKIFNKYYKKLNIIDMQTLTDELSALGYDVVFFNTPEGDEIIKSYNINVGNTKAFTYSGATRIVFIDNTLHPMDKIYALLHEFGHIAMGHFENDRMRSECNRRLETEAYGFAYAMLNPPKYKAAKVVITVIIAIIITVISVLVSQTFYYNHNNSVESIRFDTPERVDEYVDVSDMVYISLSGKYHSANCFYAKGKDCTAATLDEAKKCFEPCKICNPDKQ